MTRPLLLLLPGLLCDAEVWAAQRTAFEATHDVVVAEYGDAASLATMAGLAFAAADHRPRFAVAGHSMGGRVALEMWRAAPQRIERLALLDTGATPLPAGEAGESERAGRLRLLDIAQRDGMRAMAREWATGMVHPSQLDGPVFHRVLDMFERRTPTIFAEQIAALLGRPDARPLLPTIDVPTLLLTGAQDRWSPPAAHEAMQQSIAGATLTVVPDCGHMSPMEQPHAVNAALLAWLERTSTA